MVAAIKRPGWIRGALGALLAAAFGFGLVVALRAISGLPALPDRADRLPAGGRAADHRARSASWPASAASTTGCAGRPAMPTIPEDHSQHGAKSWKDYFQLQHRSQGDRHPVHLHHLLLLLRRRPDGDADPGRAGPAGHPDRRRRHLQQPLLDPRGADDLRLRDPGLRRDRQLRPAADDRRAGHGLPAPQRAQLLDAAAGRPALHRQLPRPRAAPSTPAGPATRRSRPGRRSGSRSSTSASSSPAPPRSRPRSTSWSRSSPCGRRG